MGRRDGDHTSKEVTEWLHNAQLLHHADGFKSVGVFDMKDLRNLTLQEYGQVGITDPSERRRLFELLQVLSYCFFFRWKGKAWFRSVLEVGGFVFFLRKVRFRPRKYP